MRCGRAFSRQDAVKHSAGAITHSHWIRAAPRCTLPGKVSRGLRSPPSAARLAAPAPGPTRPSPATFPVMLHRQAPATSPLMQMPVTLPTHSRMEPPRPQKPTVRLCPPPVPRRSQKMEWDPVRRPCSSLLLDLRPMSRPQPPGLVGSNPLVQLRRRSAAAPLPRCLFLGAKLGSAMGLHVSRQEALYRRGPAAKQILHGRG